MDSETNTIDHEAELAAVDGMLDAQLTEAGIEVKELTREGKFVALKKLAVRKAEEEAKGKPNAWHDEDIDRLVARIQERGDFPKAAPKPEAQEREPVAPRKIEFETKATKGPAVEDNIGPNWDAGATFWGNDVTSLLHAPLAEAKHLHGLSEDGVKWFRQQNDSLHMLGLCLMKDRPGMQYDRVLRNSKSYRRLMEGIERSDELSRAIKAAAMDTTADAAWIPTEFSRELQERIETERRVSGLFDIIPMPSSPYKLPVQGARPTAYKASEAVDADDTTYLRTPTTAGTSSATMTAVMIACRIVFTDELSEDSVIPMLPYIQNQVVEGIVDGIENCLVNGDTQTTHFDTGYTVAATDVRRCWIGLRRLQNQQTPSAAAVNLGTMSAANLLTIKAEMGKYGVNPRQGAWITSIAGYIKLMSLTECLTQEKYGPRAVIFEGELAQLFGSPVVVSEHVAANLNASGLYDGCVTDNTIILYVNRDAVKLGRRSANVEADRLVEYMQTQVVAGSRMAFVPLFAAATNLIVGLGHDVASS